MTRNIKEDRDFINGLVEKYGLAYAIELLKYDNKFYLAQEDAVIRINSDLFISIDRIFYAKEVDGFVIGDLSSPVCSILIVDDKENEVEDLTFFDVYSDAIEAFADKLKDLKSLTN